MFSFEIHFSITKSESSNGISHQYCIGIKIIHLILGDKAYNGLI